jgi:hydroxymethylglutaryl-CoA lyase
MMAPKIYELTLRDGLMARTQLPIRTKAELMRRLLNCSIYNFEVIRFPVDGKYPQFDEGIELLESLQHFRKDGVTMAAFAMGEIGVDEAVKFLLLFDELHIPCFVSNAYAAYAFGEWSWDRSLQLIERTLRSCEGTGVEVTVGLGTSFGCPLNNEHKISWTVAKVEDLVRLGVKTIMLGDTAGTATPGMVRATIESVRSTIPLDMLRVHFHNTFGRALLNSWTAAMCGVNGIDTSLLGLGGEAHPYFVSSNSVDNGNCATEEIFPLLLDDDLKTGVIVSQLHDTARWLAAQLDSEAPGRAGFAQFVPLEIGDAVNEIPQGTYRH